MLFNARVFTTVEKFFKHATIYIKCSFTRAAFITVIYPSMLNMWIVFPRKLFGLVLWVLAGAPFRRRKFPHMKNLVDNWTIFRKTISEIHAKILLLNLVNIILTIRAFCCSCWVALEWWLFSQIKIAKKSAKIAMFLDYFSKLFFCSCSRIMIISKLQIQRDQLKLNMAMLLDYFSKLFLLFLLKHDDYFAKSNRSARN